MAGTHDSVSAPGPSSMAVTVRCYAGLDDLLPVARRGAEVRVPFDVAPSVKDVVERLGVPHTEVDLVVVEGRSVDFAYRVRDGDRIAVYPRFHRIDVGSVTRVRAEPPEPATFVLDTHLGRLARHLRLAGFDTDYANHRDDAELARICASEHRILLTRDRGLLERNEVRYGYLVRATESRAQLAEVLYRFDLTGRVRAFTRCLACNGVLRAASAGEVAERVPKGARRRFDRFRACAACGRVYWEGTHHAALARLLEGAIGAARTGAPAEMSSGDPP